MAIKPLPNKPTVPVFDPTLGLGPVTKSYIPFTESLPQDYVQRVLAKSNIGWSGSGTTGITAGMGTGRLPIWKPTGFPYTVDGGSPTVCFEGGSRTYQWPGGVPASWFAATQKSVGMFIKISYANFTGTGGYLSGVWKVGGSPQCTIQIIVNGTTGVCTIQWVYNNFTLTFTGITLLSDVWYGILVTSDDVASPTQRIFRQYNVTTDTEITAAGGTVITDGARVLGANNSLLDCGLSPNDLGTANNAQGLFAEFWNLTHFTGLPSNADWAAWLADPNACGRGTFTPSGGMAIGDFRLGQINNTDAELCWTRATGIGTGGGTGAAVYDLFRGLTANFTPGGAGSTTRLSGSSALYFKDTGLTPHTNYFYKLRATDGTQQIVTPTDPPLIVHTKRAKALSCIVTGDSISAFPTSANQLGFQFHGNLVDLNVNNRAIAGAKYAGVWSPGIGPCVLTSTIVGGPPTSGTMILTLSLNGAGSVNSPAINWNDDATTVAGKIAGMANVGGAGNVLVSGGPFPTNPMTITFRVTHATDAYAIGTGASTLNNGATQSVAVVQQGVPKQIGYDPLVAESLRLATTVGLDFITHMLGTNDFAVAGYTAAQYVFESTQFCQAVMRDLLPTYPALKLILQPPPWRGSGLTAAISELVRSAYTGLLTIPAIVPGVYVGDDQGNFGVTANSPDSTPDGLHATTFYLQILAQNWTRGILSNVYPTLFPGSSGSSGSGHARIPPVLRPVQ